MRIAQMTDLHVGYRIPLGGGEVDTVDQVRRALRHLEALDDPVERLLLTGDLTADGRVEEYAALLSLLAGLEIPVHPIPGNHDERGPFLDAFGDAPGLRVIDGFVHSVVEDGGLRLIGVDTKETGRVSGRLCARRLDWLDATLGEQPGRPTLLFMHHPPFPTGMSAFDADGFDGAEQLGTIVARHAQIEALVAGHVHQPISRLWRGRLACTAPSTSFQFTARFAAGERLGRIMEPPALGLYHYTPAHGLAAHLAYVGPYPR